MSEISSSELSYLIQEGQGQSPEVKAALVRQFAPGLYDLAYSLAGDEANRPGTAFNKTIDTLRNALSAPDELQRYDTPQTWLFSVLLRSTRKMKAPRKLLGKNIRKNTWILLLLRYRFLLSVEHISEVTGNDAVQVRKRIRKARSNFIFKKAQKSGDHISSSIEDALDGLITWQEADNNGHLKDCESCRKFLGDIQAVESELMKVFASSGPEPINNEFFLEKLSAMETSQDFMVKSRFTLSSKETWWIAGAIAAFTIISLALNPIWSPPPPTPVPTPTIPPPQSLTNQFRDFGYRELERALLFSPLPLWQPGRILSSQHLPTTKVVLSDDGKFAAFGSSNAVILWDLEVDIQTFLEGHASNISNLAFAEHSWLATSDAAGSLILWEIGWTSPRYILSEDMPIRQFAFSHDGKTLAAASDEIISVWIFSGNELIRLRQIPAEGAHQMALSDDGLLLGWFDRLNTITIWQLSDFTFQIRFDVGQFRIADMQFSPNGNRLAASDSGGHLLVYGFTRPVEGTLTGAKIYQLDLPTFIYDINWLDDGRYLAALSDYNPDEAPPDLMIWEMSTGLPATIPFQISTLPALQSFQEMHNGNIIAADSAGTVTIPEISSPSDNPVPTEFNQSLTDIFPIDTSYQTSLNPFLQVYNQPLKTVANLIGLDLPLEEVIPEDFQFIGARYEAVNQIASFAFTRNMAPNRDERIVLRIRPNTGGNRLSLQEDWIGANVDFSHFQIGRYLGELVTGEWKMVDIDRDAPGIYRWTQSETTRFRWTQGSYLFELISDSVIATEARRWTRMFQPLAVALINAEEDVPLFRYTVQDGDTCFDIATQYGTTIARLTALNNLNSECMIFAGDRLVIPVPPPLGIFAEEDLNCDGSLDRLRLIPDPRHPTSDIYLGLVIDALPEGGAAPSVEYATFDSFTIANAHVEFFRSPKLIKIENACGQLIAFTGYGGTGIDSGLRFFVWTGDTLRLILRTDGFIDEDLPGTIFDGFSFTSQRLVYVPAQVACDLKKTTYVWKNNAFTIAGEENITGVDCFEEPLP